MTIFSRFYMRLSIILLVILGVMELVFAAITFQIFRSHQAEAEQEVNRHLARDMADEIEQLTRESLEKEKIGEIIHYMMVLNPSVEIYLLDADGTILGFYASPGKEIREKKVDTGPIKNFLTAESSLPILGDDPRIPGERKHFSAAPVELPGNETGYLYVILRGTEYDTVTGMLLNEYQLRAVAAGIAVSLPAALLLGLILFFYGTKRLQKLALAVRTFGRGNLHTRADIRGRDEIAELAISFNQMADALLKTEKEKEKSDRLRRNMVASVSHDLRNPLSSIQGYLETLIGKLGTLDRETEEKYLMVMLENTNALNRLIDNLYELSKLESKAIEPKKEQYSQAELCHDVLLKMKPAAEKANITMLMEEPAELYVVFADVALIERVLTNLIENSIKHTEPGGTITISLKKEAGNVITGITDNGSGISEEDLPRIFEMFYIGDTSRSRSKRGSGLGLGICRRIIGLHGGKIWAESQPGNGSTFSFSLPPAAGTNKIGSSQ